MKRLGLNYLKVGHWQNNIIPDNLVLFFKISDDFNAGHEFVNRIQTLLG